MTRPLRRGQPANGHTPFGASTRTTYLELLRHGLRLGEAAEKLGISRATPARYQRTHPQFAAAVEEARAVGAKVRLEGIPHDEYRYNILNCRCAQCTKAAAEGRAERRGEAANAADSAATDTAGDVHPIRIQGAVVGESSTSFLLARAS